jgi:hypothetical protein
LTAKAAAEIAGAISTSSTSFEMSPYTFLHSSMNGPFEVSFGRIPILFYKSTSIRCLDPVLEENIMTHSCVFDMFGDLGEKRLVMFCILSAHQNFERNLATLQGLQMFCCLKLVLLGACKSSNELSIPFFAVVTMYIDSKVKRNSVAGNS